MVNKRNKKIRKHNKNEESCVKDETSSKDEFDDEEMALQLACGEIESIDESTAPKLSGKSSPRIKAITSSKRVNRAKSTITAKPIRTRSPSIVMSPRSTR